MRSANRKSILLDTNILIAYLYQGHPLHESVKQRVLRLQEEGFDLWLAPQCLYEFYVVATRPTDQNGLGRTPQAAGEHIRELMALFLFADDPRRIFDKWLQLCQDYQVSGRRAHDVRLVAWMVKKGVKDLLTLNPKDFQEFTNIITVHSV
ncbi:MAG: type II toxin-antitoxin system VapC family toxin [Fimbriimonadales bacterium]